MSAFDSVVGRHMPRHGQAPPAALAGSGTLEVFSCNSGCRVQAKYTHLYTSSRGGPPGPRNTAGSSSCQHSRSNDAQNDGRNEACWPAWDLRHPTWRQGPATDGGTTAGWIFHVGMVSQLLHQRSRLVRSANAAGARPPELTPRLPALCGLTAPACCARAQSARPSSLPPHRRAPAARP